MPAHWPISSGWKWTESPDAWWRLSPGVNNGTYTISLDVVGDSEKQPNNVNVIVVFDRSGSMTTQRMNAAKTAVNSLANSLFAYNTSSAPNTVQMALVSFSTDATITRQPTTSYNQFSSSVNGLTANGGTNWEAALDEAGNVNFGDDDQTFVIFVSDGNPTFRDTRGTTEDLPLSDNPRWVDRWGRPNDYYQAYRDDQYQNGVWGLGSDNPSYANYSPTSMNRCYDAALPEAKAIVDSVGADHFFTIGAYGDVSRMQTLTTAAGAPAGNFYNANDTAALNQALADILAKIEMMGIGNTSIDDGTTNQVTTTTGEVAELLEVDESSYKYYRSGGDYGTMTEWADAPEASFENGSVVWDLASQGVLENGVKYTVTFDCYPSQETYDTIAKLKNHDITYDSLDPEIKKYIADNGNDSYSLYTNTNATLSYDDTRDEAGQQIVDYENPPAVATDAETLAVSKEWEGGDPDVDSVEMTVLMDDGEFHVANLSADNGWSDSSFISIGIIKNGQVLPGAEGHDFTFAELDGSQYHWELDTPTVHPMLINGTKTMLIKADAKHPAPSGATTYTIKGETYYVDTQAAGLKATNHRRSNLNLTKVVTGEDAPADAEFPFELTVNNSKAPDTEPTATEDPKHESDYWVWLSVRDKNGQGVTGLNMGSSVVEDSGGYYYAPSGTTFSLKIKDGWSLRFLNLPTGTKYTFVEGALPEGFAFSSSELTTGEDSTFKPGQTTTGTIENTKTSYAVKYTNNYQLTDLEITKKWVDNNNQDGKRLTADELKAKLTLSPAVQGKEPTVKDNGDGTYTITYTDLPRFNNGQEVEYTVAESAIDGYTTEGSPAKDHGTITNTHTPEVTETTVKKVWQDNDDADKVRPKSITVELYKKVGEAAEELVRSYTLEPDAEGNWTLTVSNLAKYENGTEIEYIWKEVESALNGLYSLTKTAVNGTTTTFTNSRVTIDTKTDVVLNKTVEAKGTAWAPKTFDFTITAGTATYEDGTTGTSPAATKPNGTATFNEAGTQAIDFGKISFIKAGTYSYKVKETTISGGGWTCDNTEYDVEVTVSVDDNGKLTAEVTKVAKITNKYEPTGSVELEATKKISGAAWPEGETITFTLAGEGGTLPETKTAELTAPGTAKFDAITYTEADIDKTYTYTITEDGFGDGWTADPTSITATVKVEDNGDGTLKTTVTYDPADKTITNKYAAEGEETIEVTKALEGADWPEGKTLTVTLAGEDGAPMPETTEVKLTAAGKATFGPIAYDEGTVGTILTGYLRPLEDKLRARLHVLESPSASAADAREANGVRSQIAELEQWEREVIYPLAHERVSTDLDDGVKINYNKFPRALAKVPGLSTWK